MSGHGLGVGSEYDGIGAMKVSKIQLDGRIYISLCMPEPSCELGPIGLFSIPRIRKLTITRFLRKLCKRHRSRRTSSGGIRSVSTCNAFSALYAGKPRARRISSITRTSGLQVLRIKFSHFAQYASRKAEGRSHSQDNRLEQGFHQKLFCSSSNHHYCRGRRITQDILVTAPLLPTTSARFLRDPLSHKGHPCLVGSIQNSTIQSIEM